MEFTTEKRRKITASILEQESNAETTDSYSDNINAAYGQKVEDDESNREMFITINSQLTGLSFEYALMTGYYHPMLEEQEYHYIIPNDDWTEFENKSYWDAPKLQKAGNLEEGNEFHLNTREDTSVYYPERPIKYSRWVADTHSEVGVWSPTEQELWDAIRSLVNWYNSGGSSGSTEVTIFGEYKSYEPGIEDNLQPYMTVGYTEYQSGGGSFMSDGYNPDGDLILINPTDNANFAFGKILSSKTTPSRILFAPFVVKGAIPDNSEITSTYTASDGVYIDVIYSMIEQLEYHYKAIRRYLENNPNGNDTDNLPIKEDFDSILSGIESWKETQTLGDINTLIGDIESLRTAVYVSRQDYINTFLGSANELYQDRFEINDMRLSKRMGTLREVMKSKDRIGEIFRINDEKKGQIQWLKKYFIVKKCEKDGDWKRRVFVKDPNDDIQVGDTIYILTDNVDIPEIKATVDVIVEARLEDLMGATVNEQTGEVYKEYYPVKKIFFRDAWKDGVVKVKRFFPNTYLSDENFRIIKQVE